jgi:hypothetical protein
VGWGRELEVRIDKQQPVLFFSLLLTPAQDETRWGWLSE